MGLELSFPSAGAAIVFGGSGGIGGAVCKRLAAAGVDFAFTYCRNRTAAEALQQSGEATGRRVLSCQLDLTDAAATQQAVDQAAEYFGGLHTVVYTAGPVVELKPMREIDPAQFRAFLLADMQGFFNMAHAALPHLRAARGSLVACVSMAIKRFLHRDVLSAAPKAGIEMLVRQIAGEEGCSGVRANAVALGWIEVGVGAAPANEGSLVDAFGAEEIQFWLRHSALGRSGTGEEVANAVLFLASHQASFVTGQTLCLDGGMTL
jgi:NAD(P)-dependent dehydrogenase (short-subunit alcohol dehydrogenase family)